MSRTSLQYTARGWGRASERSHGPCQAPPSPARPGAWMGETGGVCLSPPPPPGNLGCPLSDLPTGPRPGNGSSERPGPCCPQACTPSLSSPSSAPCSPLLHHVVFVPQRPQDWDGETVSKVLSVWGSGPPARESECWFPGPGPRNTQPRTPPGGPLQPPLTLWGTKGLGTQALQPDGPGGVPALVLRNFGKAPRPTSVGLWEHLCLGCKCSRAGGNIFISLPPPCTGLLSGETHRDDSGRPSPPGTQSWD